MCGTRYVELNLSEFELDGKTNLNFLLTSNNFAYRNRAEFLTVLSLITFVAFMVFRSLHFDYDVRLTTRLSLKDRENLERPVKHKTKSKKQ